MSGLVERLMLITLLLVTGCFSEPHPSCPEDTEVMSFFDVSTTKTMACSKVNSTRRVTHGWEISYIDRGEKFTTLQRVDTKLLRLICRSPDGNQTIEQDQIDRLISSSAYSANCMDKPVRPILNRFEHELGKFYQKQ